MRFILLILLMSVVAAIPNPPKTLGCAIAPHDKERVAVNVEEAIIVYDAASRTEHFIRRANFRTSINGRSNVPSSTTTSSSISTRTNPQPGAINFRSEATTYCTSG